MPITANCSHTEGAQHDCAYVEIRNALIDEAAAYADREVGTSKTQHKAWVTLFLMEMEQRWRKSAARRALSE